ncbi:methylmalonyl-CoA mutase family protein [Ureibacillus sp. MALMAid1270]|uniref:methylmalonyl-CoA mutase family protein n=1 Tax=Ureibacillus sp. MALMAid1270 TaxID=3411629 RepID=UPI003BA97E41
MKDIQFESVSYEQWKEQAIQALKGKPFDSLFTKTLEGITLEPIYTQETLIEKLGDKLENQISTIRTLKATKGFSCAQQIFGDKEEQFFSNLLDSIERGNTIITIDSRTSFEWNEQNLSKLADILTKNEFKLIIQNASDTLLSVFEKIDESNRENVKGYIISEEQIELSNFPHVRTICANTIPYHYEGANAVQELALTLALARKYVENNDFESFVNKFFVNFAIDTQFFSEIAKLRAVKVLWKAFSSAYGVTDQIKLPIVAETSIRSYSKLDIYVNLLRAGNEALSALIGGADVFTVHPHDVLTKPTDQSIRIARNVILVLKEESLVQNVTDPSGGSYFIEILTNEYVEKAWALFLEIEEAGGIDAFIESGKLAELIEEVNTNRLKAIATRKQSLIGTNIYANPVDVLPTETNPLFANVKRFATPFEELRAAYQILQPKIAILTFGQLKNFKARADFVAGFFSTAGIVCEQSGEIQSIEEAKKWLSEASYDYVVLATTDEDTKLLVPELLASKPNHLLLDVAGKYKEEEREWLAQGLNGFIFAGQNIIEKLNEVAQGLKGVRS